MCRSSVNDRTALAPFSRLVLVGSVKLYPFIPQFNSLNRIVVLQPGKCEAEQTLAWMTSSVNAGDAQARVISAFETRALLA